ncbi:hypothetical protein LSCM1_06770 [Leishmania martiniquensis]|uniref:Pre-RNA processing PIH1/Nop17 n=1 Tax=Leishmania martiniquensis TaxID=1580590 RepID=A0A836HN82_9TRYP|nr:hypothetical protein LSCM1_06770 [Leishmania martiniquensis]
MPLEHINLARERLNTAAAAQSGHGSSSVAEAATQQGGEKFTATPEELRAIQEKMKDPVFAELMHEYMRSLEDPDTRREEEAYLAQAEREAREGGDFSFEFVFPRAAFVVELLQPSNTSVPAAELRTIGVDAAAASHIAGNGGAVRSFLNFCSSDKVKAFTEHPTGDVRGSSWEVPVSVSQRRIELYKPVKSSPSASIPAEYAAARDSASESSSSPLVCIVRDAVFHPSTLALTERSARFMCFLTEIAVEHINSGYGESNGFPFRRLPSSIVSIGTPLNQTIRSSSPSGGSLFDVDPRAPVLTRPTKSFPAVKGSSCGESSSSPPPSSTSATTSMPSVTRGAGLLQSAAGEAAAAAAAASKPSSKSATLPPYTIAHRGSVNLTDAWQWRVSDKRVGVPEELVVKMTFAGVRRASALDISILPDGQAVRIDPTDGQERYEGLLVLPFTVEEAPLRAQFDCCRGVLTLTLKVVPPPLPDGAPSPDQMREALRGGAADAEDERLGEVSAQAAGGERAQGQSPPEAQSLPQRAEEAETLAKEAAPSPSLATQAESAREAPAEPPAPILAAGPSSGPKVAHIGDQSRVAAMMAQVQAAREARVAATAAMDAAHEADNGEAHAEAPAPPAAPSATLCVPDGSCGDKSAQQIERAAAAPARERTPVSAAASQEESEGAAPFLRKAPAATAAVPTVDVGDEEGDDVAALRARQLAWVAMIEKETEAAKAREEAEAAQAARATEAQAAKARRKIAAEKELERLAQVAMAKRDSLPLSNKYIFSID